MTHRRFWYRGGLGLALAIGVINYLEPPTVIRAVPRSQVSIEQLTPLTARTFSEIASTSQHLASRQASQAATNSQVDEKRHSQGDSRLISVSRASTTLENAASKQRSETATTRATRATAMVNGTVKMTLDEAGTLHLSGGSFGSSVGDDTGSWIGQTLTANGYSPTQVLKIVIDGRIVAGSIRNYNYLFSNLDHLTSVVGLANLNLSTVTSLEYLFNKDSQLQQLDFGQQNFSKVQSFKGMFNQCSALTNVVGIGQWQTTNVTDISQLFAGCSQLVALDLTGWDVSYVSKMVATFKGCSKLVTLNVANWNTRSLITLEDTFSGATSLTALPIDKWNVSKVKTLLRTFANCASLTSLNVAEWDTRQVTVMSTTFRGMTKIKSLPIDNWQTGRVYNMQLIFYEDASLVSINVANWDTRQVTSLDLAFAKLDSLTTLSIENWKTSNLETIRSTFYNSSKLQALPIANWDVSQVIDMNSTFSGCRSLTPLPIGKWNTQNVQNLGATFAGMTSVTALPVDNWQTGQVKTMSETFRQVSKVTDLPIGRWNTSRATNMSQLFADNPQLTSLPIDNWTISSVRDVSQMFAGDTGLQVLNLGAWNTANVTNFNAIFENTNLEKLDLQGWDTSQAQSYTDAFSGKLPPKRLLLGRNFNFFNSTSWKLPNPSHDSPYVGRWRSLSDNKIYTSTDLMTKYDGKTIIGEFEWATGLTLTTKYVDAEGKMLAPDTKVTGVTGEAYQIKPIEIDGYLPDQPDGVQGTFTDKDETILLKYNPGKLKFIAAPQEIDFGRNPITGKAENYLATYDTGLVVQDNRFLGSTWSLNATLAATGFAGDRSGRPLAAVLSYQDQQTGHEAALIPGIASLIVNNHQTVSHQSVNILGKTAALGTLQLKVPTDRALTETYQTTITWTLNQAVPNQ